MLINPQQHYIDSQESQMSKQASTATKEARKSATSVAEFKKRKKGITLHLPSGLSVVARRVDLTTFLQRGDVPNALLEIVEEALNKGKRMDASKMVAKDGDDTEVDMDMVNEMFETVNAVCVQSLVNPTCRPSVWTEADAAEDEIPEDSSIGEEIPEEERDDDQLYDDEIDPEDKMFIFQWAVGGTDDVATFRKESEAELASLASVEKPGKKSKRAPGDKKRKL
jgi:hypothetical protein